MKQHQQHRQQRDAGIHIPFFHLSRFGSIHEEARMAHMQLTSTLPPMPAPAGKLQLALGPRFDKFMPSPLAADLVLLTPGPHGMEKADPQAIEKNADMRRFVQALEGQISEDV